MARFGKRGGSRRLSPRPFITGLTIALVLATVGLAVLARVVPLTGRTMLVVGGASMAPAITMGSAIIVEPVDPTTLSVGDVVSVKSGPDKAIFTHRIVRLVQREGTVWLETKGEANAASDPSIVPASDVLGRVIVAVPFLGYLVAVGSQPSGVVMMVALAMLLLMLGWILDPKRTADLTTQPA